MAPVKEPAELPTRGELKELLDDALCALRAAQRQEARLAQCDSSTHPFSVADDATSLAVDLWSHPAAHTPLPAPAGARTPQGGGPARFGPGGGAGTEPSDPGGGPAGGAGLEPSDPG